MSSNIQSSIPEKYLGGIASQCLVKGVHFMGRGTGVYATDRRIIVVSGLKAIAVAKVLGETFGEGFADTVILDNKRVDNEKAIRELEDKKEFEIFKENISRIEIQVKRGKLEWGGYFNILAKDGVETKIVITDHLHNEGYEYLKALMQTACPDTLSVQG
jgi:hypothetical protein